MIGNAVPVNLAKFLAESIKYQINTHARLKYIEYENNHLIAV
jgi:hypothetical protein